MPRKQFVSSVFERHFPVRFMVFLKYSIAFTEVKVSELTAKRKALVIIIMVAFSTFSLSGILVAQPVSEAKKQSECLLLILEKLDITSTARLVQLKAENNTSFAIAEEKYNAARVKQNEAAVFIADSKFDEAVLKELEAMHTYNEILAIGDENLGGAPMATTERLVLLRVQLERLIEQLNRLECFADRVVQQGYNATILQGEVEKAQHTAANASLLISRLNETEAVAKIDALEARLKLLKVLEKALTTSINVARITTYVQQSTLRLESLRKNITSLSAVTASVQNESLTILEQAKSTLEAANSSLQERNINQTVSLLQKSKVEEQTSITILKNAGINIGSANIDASGTVSSPSTSGTEKSNIFDAAERTTATATEIRVTG